MRGADLELGNDADHNSENAMRVTGRFGLKFRLLRHLREMRSESYDRKQRQQETAQEAAWFEFPLSVCTAIASRHE